MIDLRTDRKKWWIKNNIHDNASIQNFSFIELLLETAKYEKTTPMSSKVKKDNVETTVWVCLWEIAQIGLNGVWLLLPKCNKSEEGLEY